MVSVLGVSGLIGFPEDMVISAPGLGRALDSGIGTVFSARALDPVSDTDSAPDPDVGFGKL